MSVYFKNNIVDLYMSNLKAVVLVKPVLTKFVSEQDPRLGSLTFLDLLIRETPSVLGGNRIDLRSFFLSCSVFRIKSIIHIPLHNLLL